MWRLYEKHQNALIQIAGVDTVMADKEIVIVTGADINRDIVIDKPGAMGYPEKGHNSLLKKAVSFVSCAVGKMN